MTFLAPAAVTLALAAAGAVEEIVVTGERRAQDARALAGNVSIIDGEEIERIGADHASEILARAPGVLIHRNSGVEHLTAIRSPVLTSGAGAGSFLFLENGVPLRSAGFANVNALFEAHTELAERIEIIKGPGGALYGANAIHGLVNVLTPAPGESLSVGLDFSGDTLKRFKANAFVTDTAGSHGYHAGVSVIEEGGWRDDAGVSQRKATLRHDFAGARVRTATIVSINALDQDTAGFVAGPDAYRDRALRRTNPNPNAYRKAAAVRASSRIEADIAENATLALTPFFRWTDMEFLLHFFPSQALEENRHWSVGAQSALYAEPSDKFSLIAGADWEYAYGFLRETQSIPTIGTYTQGVHYDYAIDALAVSGFAQGRYKLAPRLTLLLAARADWTRYDYDNRTATGVVGRFLRPPDRKDAFLTVSPKASLAYALDDGIFYASYARGARPPQTTDLYRLQINQTIDPAAPETIDAVEIGWRGALSPAVQADLAVYYMEKENFFFRDADGFNVNDGRTRHLGADASITAQLTDSLRLSANAGYARHTYRFDRPVLSLPSATEAISSGDDVDTAPRWLAGARALWRPQGGPFELEGEWVFVGAYFMDAANTQSYPGHHLLHLRGAWRLGERFALTLALRNALDRMYAERADFAFNEARYFPGEPRTLAVGFRARL